MDERNHKIKNEIKKLPAMYPKRFGRFGSDRWLFSL